MKITILTLGLLLLVTSARAGTTITYTYDKQHRLTSADYSAAQTDAHVAYQYDAANNLDVYAAIADGQYLKSFLWYFSWLPSLAWPPDGLAGISWPQIWAAVFAKS